MCGRFALFVSGEELAERYPFVEIPALESCYNVAPTQAVPAVRATPTGHQFGFLRWGLIPSWASALVVTHKSRDPDFRLWAERIPSPR